MMDKQKGQDKRLQTVLLCIFGAFLAGFLTEVLGFTGTFLFLFVWGALIAVYYWGVSPVLERHTLNAEETPKSFLKKCVNCGREIPIASEQCQFCKAKQ